MTEAQGTTAIENTLQAFARERATLTFSTADKEYEVNAALTARLVAALDDAWSE